LNGRFANRTDYLIGDGLVMPLVADFNADGRPDIAVTSISANMVSVLLGDGNGTFGGRTDYRCGGAPCWAASSDFDHDGRLDLAVANSGSNTVSALLSRAGRLRPRERRYPVVPQARVDSVLGVSEPLPINAAAGAVDRPGRIAALAIRGATPNPATGGRLRVEFALRDGSPARLELLDVAGRVVSARDVSPLGAGTHVLDLSDGRALRPGMYLLRLTQGASVVRARAAVLR